METYCVYWPTKVVDKLDKSIGIIKAGQYSCCLELKLLSEAEFLLEACSEDLSTERPAQNILIVLLLEGY